MGEERNDQTFKDLLGSPVLDWLPDNGKEMPRRIVGQVIISKPIARKTPVSKANKISAEDMDMEARGRQTKKVKG